MGEHVMKITDHASGEVYWMTGHDHTEARNCFGEDIDIVDMVAMPVADMVERAG